MAELVGILLEDGSLSLRSQNPKSINRLKISFNSKDDGEYLEYVKNLIKKIFDMNPILKYRKGENTADLFIFKKEIIELLVDKIGLELSPKWNNALIPKQFINNYLELIVLKGLFDTDGCLVRTNNNGIIYPRLEIKICPSPMQKQIIDILNYYEFNFGVYKIGKGKVRIQLNGKKQLKKWVELVGFSNSKHLNKARVFLT